MANRTVSVALVADVGQYQSAMTKAAATTRTVGEGAEAAGHQTRRGFDIAGRGALLLGGALTAGAVGIRSAINAASDLNETINKSNVIFGDNAGDIQRWAQGAARDFGLSRQAALEAASGFGNMLTQLGYTGDQAMKASTDVVKLAADLGSFNNLDTGDVLDRIGAAMRGEYDSLQLLIPNINAARVEQEAMAETGKTNADSLTAQEKAAATLAIVQRDGAAAADDFAETSDGLANSQKILNAEWQDAQAKLGDLLVGPMTGMVNLASNALIPALEGVVSVVGEAVQWFTDLPGPVQAGIAAFAGYSALRGPLTDFFETVALKAMFMKDSVVGATTTVGGMKAAASGLLGFLGGPVGLAIAGVTLAIGLLSDSTEENSATTDEAAASQQGLADALRQSKGAIDANVRAAAAKAAQDAGLLDIAEQMGIPLERVTDAILGQNGAYDELMGQMFQAQQLGTDFNGNQTDLSLAIEDGRVALEGLAGQTEGNIVSAQQLSEATDGTSASIGQLTGAVGLTGEALEKWSDDVGATIAGFVDPVGVYTGLVQQVAQSTADSTDSSTDSWQDYAADTTVSLDEVARQLEEQISAQENWRTNIVLATQRGGIEVGQALAAMGTEGAGFVQQMVNASDEEFNRLRDLMIQDAHLGGAGAASELQTQMAVMAAVGAAGAGATVQGIAYQLGLGADQVRAIAGQYGVNLAEGVNPILQAVGQSIISVQNVTAGWFNSRTPGFIGPVAPNADGNLYEDHQAEIAPGGAIRVWAEPETGGESYIPHNPAKRGRSLDIWRRTGRILGAPEVAFFANGGFTTADSVPRPPSTAPARHPLSTAGDAAMDTMYRATTNWLREHGPVGGALEWARSQVGKPYIWGGVGPAGYDCSGFMSAITNVLLGRSPHSRVGATATFPWKGFLPGIGGVFTVGSTKDAGGGVGHMAGTLMGTNVESRGGQGVVVGSSARGASNSLFNTRAHLAMATGGVIGEPVFGQGMWSGRSYSFGERGPELVSPIGREWSGAGAMSGASGGSSRTVNYHTTVNTNPDDARIARVVERVMHEREVLASPWTR